MKIAVIPGSFDPMTVGHIDIIRRSLKIFDKVIVAVMINDKKSYMFSLDERYEIARLSCEGLENVEVIADRGLLSELADRVGACAVVKGVRNEDDYRYEAEMAYYNRFKNPRVETLIMPCDNALDSVSSTELRRRIADGRDISDIISANAVTYIDGLIKEKGICKK